MESLLNILIANLRYTAAQLRGPLHEELQAAIFDPEKLPDKKLSALAGEAEDLLEQISLLIQPSVSLLADNFLGRLFRMNHGKTAVLMFSIAYINTKCLWTAVTLGIPDFLSNGSKGLDELAELAGAKPERLRQVLRVLYNQGIFAFDAENGLYRNSPASSLLRKDHWTQWCTWTDLYGNEFYDMARGIPESVKRDCERTAAQVNYGTEKSMFEYFRDQGELERLIGTIGAGAVAQAPGMVEDYDWGEIAASGERLLDIGGGSGAFMASLLRRHGDMKGAVLDQESVITKFTPLFRESGGQFFDVGGRCDLIVGDFFDQIPPFRYYTMKWCLHDWTDEQVIRILRNVRDAIIEGPGSRLVIIEAVLTEGRRGAVARYGDITMMVASGGRERDCDEWKSVAEASGWSLASVTPFRNAWPSAIELRPRPRPRPVGLRQNGGA